MPAYLWVTIFFLALIGHVAVVSNVFAQDSTECIRQTFSLVDCHHSSPGDEESDGDVNSDNDNEVEIGNIEEQVPSVIPFP